MCYVYNMRYLNNISYVNNMSYVCRLYELYELCKSYECFYESLKISCFLFIYKVEKLNCKNENIERIYLNDMQKKTIFNRILAIEKDFIELRFR